ncbi:MAG: transporter [Pseudomonadota bacterium]
MFRKNKVFFLTLSIWSMVSVCFAESTSQSTSSKNIKESVTIRLLMQRIEKLEAQVSRLTEEKVPFKNSNTNASLNNAEQTLPQQSEASSTNTETPLSSSNAALASLMPYSSKELERKEDTALQSALSQNRGLVLPAHTLEIEPSFTYSNYSSDVINIDGFTILPVLVVGNIKTERLQHRTLNSALSLRYGITDDLQADIRIPVQFDDERRFSNGDTTMPAMETRRTRKGFGDIELGITKQFWQQEGNRPGGLFQLQWKTKTGKSDYGNPEVLSIGTGFNALRTGVTFIKTMDPAAVFSSIGYTWNLPGDSSMGRVNPGNTTSLYLGTSVALSNSLALSFGYEQRWTGKSKINGVEAPGSSLEVGTFKTGSTFALTKDRSLDVSIGMGLTRDAPSYSLSVAMPIRF